MPTDAVLVALAFIFGLAAAVAAPVLFTRLVAAQAERAVPPLGLVTMVDGTRLHWVERGEGQAVVLVHGLATQMRSLTFPLLDDLARDFHVLAIDRPGSGWSGRRADGRIGLNSDADTLASFIRERGLERPLVVGHSMGGAVALATAARHPDLLGGLALVAPLTTLVDEAPEAFRTLEVGSRVLRRVIAETFAVPLTLLLQPRVLRRIFAPEPVPDTFAIDGGGVLSRRPRAFMSASEDLFAVPKDLPGVESAYGDLDLPVAVLYGDADAILDPDVHGIPMRDRVPGATVEIVAGGHMLPFTQPERVRAFVRETASRVDR